jgi:hypothetical protein
VQRLLDGDAGIVEGDVEPAIGACRAVDESLHLVLDQHVGLHIEGLSAGGPDLALDLLAEVRAAAAEGDLAALGGEGQRRGASDARSRPGDGDDLAFETPAAGRGRQRRGLGRQGHGDTSRQPGKQPGDGAKRGGTQDASAAGGRGGG